MQVWQESRKVVREIRSVCKRPLVKHDFAFIDQITRAARSISANIAEGNDSMTTPQFITFLGYAKASAAEVRSHLFDALDEKYISDEEFKNLFERSKAISKMLAKLIHYLQSTDLPLPRTMTSLPAL